MKLEEEKQQIEQNKEPTDLFENWYMQKEGD